MSVLIQRIQERLGACNTNVSRASIATGFGRQYIRDILVGKSKSPSVDGLAAIAEVLGCSVSYLIGESDEVGEPDAGFVRSQKAQRLFDLRNAAEFASASEAARAAGVSVSTYIHHENGTREYNEQSARIYADTFGSSVAWLLLGLKTPDQQTECADVSEAKATTIGNKIRQARKSLNMGQAELADFMGVTVQAVSQWERNENMPSGINLLKLSEHLRIDLPHGINVHPENIPKLAELLEQVEEIHDLLHALDKVGDGIGGSDGFAVSAVALNAKSIADNVINALKAMGAK